MENIIKKEAQIGEQTVAAPALLVECRTELAGSPWEYTITTDLTACRVTMEFTWAQVTTDCFGYPHGNPQALFQAFFNEDISDEALCAIDRQIRENGTVEFGCYPDGVLRIRETQADSYLKRRNRPSGTTEVPLDLFPGLWQDYRQARLACLRQKAAQGYYAYKVIPYPKTGVITVTFDEVDRKFPVPAGSVTRMKHPLGFLEFYLKDVFRDWENIYLAEHLRAERTLRFFHRLPQHTFCGVDTVALWEDFVWIGRAVSEDGVGCLVSAEVFRSIVVLYKEAYQDWLRTQMPDAFRNFTYDYMLHRDPWNRCVTISFPKDESPFLKMLTELVERVICAGYQPPVLPQLQDNSWTRICGTNTVIMDGTVWLCDRDRKIPPCVVPLPVLRRLLTECRDLWMECLKASNQPGQEREYYYHVCNMDGDRWMAPECPSDPVLRMVADVCDCISQFLEWKANRASGERMIVRYEAYSSNITYFFEVLEDDWVRVGKRKEDIGVRAAVCLPVAVLERIGSDLQNAPDSMYDFPEKEEDYPPEEELHFYGKTDPRGYPRNASGKKKYLHSRNRPGRI